MTVGLPDRRLELKKVVQLGKHQEKADLLADVAEYHDLPPLGSPALDQHQRTESGGVDMARAAQIDDQTPQPFGQFIQQPNGGLPDLYPRIQPERLRGFQ